MNKHEINYTDEPIGEVKIIDDFLPSPEHLVLKEETVKVYTGFDQRQCRLFKKVAREQHTHYQTMIRALLDHYTEHYRR